jgi:hypothetical protein
MQFQPELYTSRRTAPLPSHYFRSLCNANSPSRYHYFQTNVQTKVQDQNLCLGKYLNARNNISLLIHNTEMYVMFFRQTKTLKIRAQLAPLFDLIHGLNINLPIHFHWWTFCLKITIGKYWGQFGESKKMKKYMREAQKHDCRWEEQDSPSYHIIILFQCTARKNSCELNKPPLYGL